MPALHDNYDTIT